MKIVSVLSTVILSAGLAQAGLFINAGSNPVADVGPTGATTGYQTYITAHENATSGQVETYTGVSFAEGGVAGSYDVGVGFSWPNTTDVTVPQSYGRTDNGYGDYWHSHVGMDTRTSSGGVGTGTQMQLNLTGLAPSQAYVLTSSHFDSQNQAGTFTVDQNLAGTTDQSTVFDYPKADQGGGVVLTDLTPWLDNQYSFDVTSDASGNLDVTYTSVTGSWIGLNGFEIVAVPEPATLGLVAVFGGGILFIRRRFMM